MTPHDQLLFSIWRHGRDAGLTLEQIDKAMAREIQSSRGGVEVADTQKPEICSVEFRGKKSQEALPGSRAFSADATAWRSSAGVASCPLEAHSALRGLDAVVDAALNQIHESGVVVSFPVRSPSRPNPHEAA